MLTSHRAFYSYVAIFFIGIGMILGLLAKLAPLTVTHALYYCQQIITRSHISLPHSLPVIIVLGFFLIFFSGALLFSIKVYVTRRHMSKLLKNKIQMPDKVKKVAQNVNLEKITDIVQSNEWFSFSYGLVFPRICVSSATIEILNESELKAVLLHESSHIKNYDPLKILLTQVISAMFFFLPVLKDFQRYFTLAKEVDADNLVVTTEGGSASIRSALTKLITQTKDHTIPVAAFAQNAMFEERVLLLAGMVKKVPINLSPLNSAMSGVLFTAALLFMSVPLYAMEVTPESHAYLVCPGNNCAAYCVQKEATSNDLFHEPKKISQQYFTPAH